MVQKMVPQIIILPIFWRIGLQKFRFPWFQSTYSNKISIFLKSENWITTRNNRTLVMLFPKPPIRGIQTKNIHSISFHGSIWNSKISSYFLSSGETSLIPNSTVPDELEIQNSCSFSLNRTDFIVGGMTDTNQGMESYTV